MEVSPEEFVVWFVSIFDVVAIIEVLSIPLAIVVEIIVDTISDKVWFFVREVVAIFAIFVDTTSDKAWVTFTVVVGALFYFSCSIQAKLSSFVFSTQVWVSEFSTG